MLQDRTQCRKVLSNYGTQKSEKTSIISLLLCTMKGLDSYLLSSENISFRDEKIIFEEKKQPMRFYHRNVDWNMRDGRKILLEHPFKFHGIAQFHFSQKDPAVCHWFAYIYTTCHIEDQNHILLKQNFLIPTHTSVYLLNCFHMGNFEQSISFLIPTPSTVKEQFQKY